jgi:hypothetical protein
MKIAELKPYIVLSQSSEALFWKPHLKVGLKNLRYNQRQRYERVELTTEHR